MKFTGTVSFKIKGEADSLEIFKKIVLDNADCITVVGAGDCGYHKFDVVGKPSVKARKKP